MLGAYPNSGESSAADRRRESCEPSHDAPCRKPAPAATVPSAAEVVDTEAEQRGPGLRRWPGGALAAPPALWPTEPIRPAEGDLGIGGAVNDGASGHGESGIVELGRGEGAENGSGSEFLRLKVCCDSDRERRAGWVGEGKTCVGDWDARRARAGGSCVCRDEFCPADHVAHVISKYAAPPSLWRCPRHSEYRMSASNVTSCN